MGSEETVPRKSSRPEAAANMGDSRAQLTVVAAGATDKATITPTILRGSRAPELSRDFQTAGIRAGNRVPPLFGYRPTRNESLTVRLFRNRRSRRRAQEFVGGAPRILISDLLKGQLEF